jgi:hypothetical protein
MIEPHAGLLKKPDKEAFLYKIIPSKYFLDMLKNNYLYFRRVDTYYDDQKDSAQPENHRRNYGNITFENAPNFELTDYYNRFRSRTYACCFTTENTEYIREHYSNGDPNAVCLAFKYGPFIDQLNSTYKGSKILLRDQFLDNFLNINYGIVTYGTFNEFISKRDGAANPIEFAYFKDKEKFSEEKEFRITLSTHGMPKKFQLSDKSEFIFPESIQLGLSLREAIISKSLQTILISEKSTSDFRKELERKINKYNIKIKFTQE